ncbi:hypothetical protein E2C01_071583 [Portunus trituberculatus]|uniref:Uncharacterized protein n=1 Tax=Portunus trituberculatus TaxID=210409 RepID=A0A5B7I6K9_PORTR|nr:hypothetical protein [Portunus trituberculatus]
MCRVVGPQLFGLPASDANHHRSYRSSEDEGNTWDIAWNVPGEHHGNGNSKQHQCNAPQSVNLVQSNYHIENLPYRSFYRDRTHSIHPLQRSGAGRISGQTDWRDNSGLLLCVLYRPTTQGRFALDFLPEELDRQCKSVLILGDLNHVTFPTHEGEGLLDHVLSDLPLPDGNRLVVVGGLRAPVTW